MNLRVPGPTPCPDEVLQAGAAPMINHRGPEFAAIMEEVTANLKEVFQTKNDLLVLTASGTGVMEAAVVNTLSPGDKVLCVSIGAFGDRLAAIAQAFGAQVIKQDFRQGSAADPEAIREALSKDSEIRALLVTHNETSTGVTNDMKAISRVAKELDKLIIVDAISSMSSIPFPVDEWGCDIVMSGSQKGWMCPPGLAMVSVSERAWEAHKHAKMPRYYWDFTQTKRSLEHNETPWTPAVSIFASLQVALRLMKQEGMANIYARQERIGRMTREGIKALGLSPFADASHASNTVTAVTVPEGINAGTLIKTIRDEHNVELAGGQGSLTGKIFRVGHLGHVTEEDISQVLAAIRESLPKVGFTGGLAPQTAQEVK
ncbi:MAG: alanine--glyoxylate aminotransferase family protein [Dehalococcoidia bacterium]|nr:alanine--glyoxylate aminotransferase family protein [Dehalococcoidia bacterium]